MPGIEIASCRQCQQSQSNQAQGVTTRLQGTLDQG